MHNRKLAIWNNERRKEEFTVENPPMFPTNTTQESSKKKTITDIHQQPLEETDDTIEDITYKLRPSGQEEDKTSIKVHTKTKIDEVKQVC